MGFKRRDLLRCRDAVRLIVDPSPTPLRISVNHLINVVFELIVVRALQVTKANRVRFR